MIDGSERSIIDIEREGRALSILVLDAQNNVNWKWVYSKLLYGVVNESGVWSKKVIDGVRDSGIILERRKHVKVLKSLIRELFVDEKKYN